MHLLCSTIENHTLEYGNFEGTIPQGEYGAGIVKIWDKGTYEPLDTSSSKRVFELKGRKLMGVYTLIKLKPKDEADKNWLFFKTKNEAH